MNNVNCECDSIPNEKLDTVNRHTYTLTNNYLNEIALMYNMYNVYYISIWMRLGSVITFVSIVYGTRYTYCIHIMNDNNIMSNWTHWETTNAPSVVCLWQTKYQWFKLNWTLIVVHILFGSFGVLKCFFPAFWFSWTRSFCAIWE